MKPLPERRQMAADKARRERRRYTWVYDHTGFRLGHFEILDAGFPNLPLCDVIATTDRPRLRDEFIEYLEQAEYQPSEWPKGLTG